MTKRKIYLRISIAVIAIGIILSSFYRPYIYRNNISDFGFADTIGSLMSVIGFCTFVWSRKEYSNRIRNIHITLATFIYGIFWEFLGYINLYGTFDKKDIAAAAISGIFTYFINIYIEYRYQKKELK